MAMGARVRQRRKTLQLSQADLGRAAGVSRQLVAAVETARHTPNVAAALALAGALETTVEALFGPETGAWEPVLEAPAPEGAGIVAGRVGNRLVYAALTGSGTPGHAWQRADGVYREGHVQLFSEVEPEGFVVAGCDPALGLASALLPQAGPRRLVFVPATSSQAAGALDRGRVHAALVHGQPPHLPRTARPTESWSVARWSVGLAARRGTAVELDLIASGRLKVARRDPGAEAQRALERALRGYERPRLVGPIAGGHLEAARLVAEKVADVGVTMEATARAFGLVFEELEQHTAELRVDRRWRAHPGAAALSELISSKDFAVRLDAVGGYELLAS